MAQNRFECVKSSLDGVCQGDAGHIQSKGQLRARKNIENVQSPIFVCDSCRKVIPQPQGTLNPPLAMLKYMGECQPDSLL